MTTHRQREDRNREDEKKYDVVTSRYVRAQQVCFVLMGICYLLAIVPLAYEKWYLGLHACSPAVSTFATCAVVVAAVFCLLGIYCFWADIIRDFGGDER